MSECLRLPGELLDLNLQLHDGVDTMPKRVFVVLKDENGAPAGSPIEITHVSDGYFKESAEVMPSNRMLSAHYYVKDDSGTPSDGFNDLADSVDHGVVQKVFRRADAVGSLGEIILDRLDSKLSALNAPIVNLEGEILDQEILEGEISDECL